jgi:deoxyribodipyrimidine photo-lyase
VTTPLSVFWFRRDLRLEDNAGFSQALASGRPVLPIFIFDPFILDSLPRDDARVTFIYDTLQMMRTRLQAQFSRSLALYHGKPLDVFDHILRSYLVAAVYTNHDYEPYARERDDVVRKWLRSKSVDFHTCKDHVLFEKDEVAKEDGSPYVVYTPYMRKWKAIQSHTTLITHPTGTKLMNLIQQSPLPDLSLADIGFSRSTIAIPPYRLNYELLQHYERDRDFPAIAGTSQLGPHLRFGTVSIRKILQVAHPVSETFCNELIWREFFCQILWHFPHTQNKSFKSLFDHIQWSNNEAEFKRWCEGMTGYPLVDAGMRQLNATGFMHNRVRMITASFLCKHLLIDWRWGEAYFAEKLLDYEMASNVGNWQWIAGCGVDAAPYFRVFNPTTQIKRFDKDFEYIQTWVKDLHASTYPKPIVDHAFARARYLEICRQAVS